MRACSRLLARTNPLFPLFFSHPVLPPVLTLSASHTHTHLAVACRSYAFQSEWDIPSDHRHSLLMGVKGQPADLREKKVLQTRV